MIRATAIYLGAAVLEIAGCFGFWSWWRKGASAWWLLASLVALAGFAALLMLVDTRAAGRAYAAYGGIYIAVAMAWLWLAEGVRPDRWDWLGASLCVIGATIIFAVPRAP